MNDTETKKKIKEKKQMIDRNGHPYLILKLENEEAIFVFSSKVEEKRWIELEEEQEYDFTVEAGSNGSNLLIDFK